MPEAWGDADPVRALQRPATPRRSPDRPSAAFRHPSTMTPTPPPSRPRTAAAVAKPVTTVSQAPVGRARPRPRTAAPRPGAAAASAPVASVDPWTDDDDGDSPTPPPAKANPKPQPASATTRRRKASVVARRLSGASPLALTLQCRHGCLYKAASHQDRVEHEAGCELRVLECRLGCGEKFSAMFQAKHEKACPWRVVACRFDCGAAGVTALRIGEHEAGCGRRALPCPAQGCAVVVELRDTAAHLAEQHPPGVPLRRARALRDYQAAVARSVVGRLSGPWVGDSRVDAELPEFLPLGELQLSFTVTEGQTHRGRVRGRGVTDTLGGTVVLELDGTWDLADGRVAFGLRRPPASVRFKRRHDSGASAAVPHEGRLQPGGDVVAGTFPGGRFSLARAATTAQLFGGAGGGQQLVAPAKTLSPGAPRTARLSLTAPAPGAGGGQRRPVRPVRPFTHVAASPSPSPSGGSPSPSPPPTVPESRSPSPPPPRPSTAAATHAWRVGSLPCAPVPQAAAPAQWGAGGRLALRDRRGKHAEEHRVLAALVAEHDRAWRGQPRYPPELRLDTPLPAPEAPPDYVRGDSEPFVSFSGFSGVSGLVAGAAFSGRRGASTGALRGRTVGRTARR